MPVNCASDPERAGGGDQPQDREEQRDPGRGERAEGDGEHGQRDRPGHHLGAQHRGLVLLVELRPQPRGAGERYLDSRSCRRLEPIAEATRGAHHVGCVGGRAAAHDGHSAVRRDRLAGPGRPHRSDCGVAPQQARHAADRRAEGRARAVVRPRADDRDAARSCPARRSAGRSDGGPPRTPSHRPASRRRTAPARRAERARRGRRRRRPRRARPCGGGWPPSGRGDPAGRRVVASRRSSVRVRGGRVELGHGAKVRAGPQPVMGHSPQLRAVSRRGRGASRRAMPLRGWRPRA